MKNRLFSLVVGLALAFLSLELTATTYYVATDGNDSAAGTEAEPLATVAAALAKNDVTEVVIGVGTYAQSAVISLTTGVTVRGKTGVATDVTLDFQEKSQGFSINHASAVVQDLRIYRAKSIQNGAGVAIGSDGGTLRNCVMEKCFVGNQNRKGVLLLSSANALVSGCEIRSCGTSGANAELDCMGVYVENGATLENTLVVGTYETSTYADGKRRACAVYLAKGKVKNCTIADNTVSHYALYCADAATCEVTDTISFGNTALIGLEENGPNVNVLGSKCVVNNLYTANPMFADSANGDYTLAPGSPCIAAGAGGGDLGYKPYDASRAALGIKASVRTGTAPLGVSVALTSANVDLTGATVVWEGLDETGTSFTHSFGGGNHALKATVTLANSTVMVVSDPKALSVTYPAGEYTASTADELDAMLKSPLADGVVIKLAADTTYTLPANFYKIIRGVKIVVGGRESTILKKKSNSGRFFLLNHEDAEIDSLTMTGGSAGGSAGGVWIDANGGTLSNCVVSACKSGASQAGGGVWMNSTKALVTHCKISKNVVGQNTYCGGVRLCYGTLANSLIVGNTAEYADRVAVLGAGIYMEKDTADAKVINCTVSDNVGYSGSGIYRVANAGYVYNTLVYGNTANYAGGEPDFTSGGGSTRPDADSILNGCSSKVIGSNAQTVSAAPYDPDTYELVGEKAGACINKGDSSKTVGDEDYFGNARISGASVDIGAHEYASTTITVGIDASVVSGVDSANLTFSANVQGGEPSAYAWYVDGSSSVAGTESTFSKTFTTGRHTVSLVVTIGDTEYPAAEPKAVTIYSSHVYVDANSSAEPVWPYPQDAPATNIDDAVIEALVSGVTIHVAEGLYASTNRATLGADMHVVGAGMDKTIIYHKNHGATGFGLQASSATVDGLCVSNSTCSKGGGFDIQAGTATCCRVTYCKAEINQEGGGVNLRGGTAVFDRGIVTDCERYQANGFAGCYGGVAVDSGKLRNTLVTRCKSNNGGGVYLRGGEVCNCTIVGNVCTNSNSGGGGIYAVPTGGGVLRNTILWDNLDIDLKDPASPRNALSGATAGVSCCCIPYEIGTGCVTADPQFKDAVAGDYRIGAGSPCAYSGLYQAWMADATDFFGTPRATPGKKVSIGFCQAPAPGLLLFLR